MNEKRAAIDLAKSERETIAKKFEVVREAKEEAESTKTRLQGEKEAKVSVTLSASAGDMITHQATGSGTERSTSTESWNGRRTRQAETALASTFLDITQPTDL